MTSSRSSTMGEHALDSPFAAGVVVAARLSLAPALRPDGARQYCSEQLPRERWFLKMGSADATARRIAVSGGSETGGLYRRQRAQIGGDRVEIGERDRLVPIIGHRVRELRPVRADAGGDRALDLGIAPFADAVLRVGGDVAADDPFCHIRVIGQVAAAGIKEAPVGGAAGPRHAVAAVTMPDRSGEVRAIGELLLPR